VFCTWLSGVVRQRQTKPPSSVGPHSIQAIGKPSSELRAAFGLGGRCVGAAAECAPDALYRTCASVITDYPCDVCGGDFRWVIDPLNGIQTCSERVTK